VAGLLHAPCLAALQKGPTTSTLTGVVKASDNNKISGAAVTLTDLQTGRTVAINTEASGEYRFTDLDPQHDYQIQASFRGWFSETTQLVSLGTPRDLVVDLAISEQAVADRLARLLNWRPGGVVAEIGAGKGWLTLAAAERVGSSGHVFTTELDPRLLVNLEGLAARQKVQNITVIKAGEAQTNLPPECCDSIFMRHVYHHFMHPAQEDASLFQSLKPGGILAVIDFSPSQDANTLDSSEQDVPKNRGRHGITKERVVDELTAAGFQVVTPTNWPGEDYCVVFRKPPQ
jgi:protein-L-isoaspartate O-methyltransferase